jgi:hypothetical protein
MVYGGVWHPEPKVPFYEEGPYIAEASKSGQLCCHMFFIHLPILPFGEKILMRLSTCISKSGPFD